MRQLALRALRSRPDDLLEAVPAAAATKYKAASHPPHLAENFLSINHFHAVSPGFCFHHS